MKVLVTGASGFVGSELCRQLVNDGFEVRALYRDINKCVEIKDLDLELVQADIRERESLESVFKDIDIIFHIAALFRQAKNPDSVYYDINVEGVRNVFDMAIKANVKKIIHCSTVGVHSHIINPPATEEEDYRPGDIYQETKAEGERLALKYFSEGKIKGAVIRPAMIWGPGDTRTLKLFKGIANCKFPLIGTGKTLVHWILVSDLASAFISLAKADINNEIYIISGERAVELQYMLKAIAREFNVKAPSFKIPAWPIQIIGSVVELICKPFGIEPPIYRRRVDFFTKTRSFDSSKASRDFGFKPKNSFEEEVNLIGNWYKEKGWI
jgi:nucleoside-diphosphate-sugar epimerase